MPRRVQKTRIIMGGTDISNHVQDCTLYRRWGEVDTLDATLFVERFEEADGALVIHVSGPELGEA